MYFSTSRLGVFNNIHLEAKFFENTSKLIVLKSLCNSFVMIH